MRPGGTLFPPHPPLTKHAARRVPGVHYFPLTLGRRVVLLFLPAVRSEVHFGSRRSSGGRRETGEGEEGAGVSSIHTRLADDWLRGDVSVFSATERTLFFGRARARVCGYELKL